MLTLVVGIPSANSAAAALVQLVHHARSEFASAPEALAAVALALAGEHRHDLQYADLRLLRHLRQQAEAGISEPMAEALVEIGRGGMDGSHLLGRLHELLLEETDRKITGAHLTPSTVADGVVAMLDDHWCEAAEAVLDPAVGGGAFLLAALDRMVDRGIDPSAAIDRVRGIDINGDAVAVAETALVLWGLGHGVTPRQIGGLQQGDGLLDELPSSSVVLGNPPFLSQLRAASSNMGDRRALLRERWGALVGAYTDEAWLFLAAGVRALTDRGQLAMVQPLSVLAARHGAAVREHVGASCDLAGVWLSNGRVFDAAVEVCAVTLRHRGERDESPPSVGRWSGAGFEPVEPLVQPPAAHQWGTVAAPIAGIPHVLLKAGETVASLATATAGFRDQFYGFAPHVVESSTGVDGGEPAHRLVTVGMIDPLLLRWGSATFRFAKHHWQRPRIDRDGLQAADPELDEWLQNRMKPKLLVATQTRVIETWVDQRGDAVPATPVISLEPFDPEMCWHLAAALSSPPLSAHAASLAFGTALAVRALKLSARALLELPLPTDRVAWNEGADLSRSASQLVPGEDRRAMLVELGAVMASAYGIHARELEQWWHERLPHR